MIKAVEYFRTIIDKKEYEIGLHYSGKLVGFFAYGMLVSDSFTDEIGPGHSKTSSDEAILKLVKLIENGK